MDKTKIVCEWCGSNRVFPIHTVFSWITRNEFYGLTRRHEYQSKWENPQVWSRGDSFACYFGCLDCDEVTQLIVAGDNDSDEVDYSCASQKLTAKNDEFVEFLKEESRKTKDGVSNVYKTTKLG